MTEDQLVSALVNGGMALEDAEFAADEISVLGVDHPNVSAEAQSILYGG